MIELLKAKESKLSESEKRIGKLNKESADRRIELKKYKDADTTREREAMSEAERAKAEAGDWQQKYEAIAAEHNAMKSRLAFVEAGATDPDSVLLYWNALSADDQAKSSPSDYAKTLAKTKPHLFQVEKPTDTGPNPRGDGASSTGKSKIPHSPKSREDKAAIDAAWGAMASRR